VSFLIIKKKEFNISIPFKKKNKLNTIIPNKLKNKPTKARTSAAILKNNKQCNTLYPACSNFQPSKNNWQRCINDNKNAGKTTTTKFFNNNIIKYMSYHLKYIKSLFLSKSENRRIKKPLN
jgi:hypothetical protein